MGFTSVSINSLTVSLGSDTKSLDTGNSPRYLSSLETTNILSVLLGNSFLLLRYLITTSSECLGLTLITSVFNNPPAESSEYSRTVLILSLSLLAIFDNTLSTFTFGKFCKISTSSSISKSEIISTNSSDLISAINSCCISSWSSARISPSVEVSSKDQINLRSFGGRDSIECAISDGFIPCSCKEI